MDNHRDVKRNNNQPPRRPAPNGQRPPQGQRGPAPRRPRPEGPAGRPPQAPSRPMPARGPQSRPPQDPQRQAAAAANSAMHRAGREARQYHYHEEAQTRAPKPRQQRKQARGLMILLDILIIGLILTVAFLLLYPKYINSKQEGIRDQILASLRDSNQRVELEIGADDYKVPGEQLEAWSTQPGESFADEMETPGGKVKLTYTGRLVISKIDADIPLAPVTDSYHLRFGSTILQDSAPIASNGQSVIFGHRFLTKGRDFNRLDELNAGDTFYIDMVDENLRYLYRVDKQLIIKDFELKPYVYPPGNVAAGYSPEDNTVLLVTCHPAVYRASNERLLIFAHVESKQPIK